MANPRRKPTTARRAPKPPEKPAGPETGPIKQATTDAASEHLDTTPEHDPAVPTAPGASPDAPVQAPAPETPAESKSEAKMASTRPDVDQFDPEVGEPDFENNEDPEVLKALQDEADLAELDEQPFRKQWLDWCKERNVVFPEGRVLFPEEPITFTGNKMQGNIVMVTQDIYRLHIPMRSTRPGFTLVARAGTTVPDHMVVSKENYNEATEPLLNEFKV